ncbi:MAG: hypothetical protein RL136_921 [Planctomycetota bacterium]|jgi:hypothetical protein
MSRISTTWDIGRSTGQCAVTGAPLVPGAPCIVALVEREEDLSAPPVRLDFTEEGWESPKRPREILAFWRTVVAEPNEKRRGFVDDQMLLDLFERLGADERPHRVRFRFVLMLLLLRKKLLRIVETTSEGGVEYWRVLPKGAAEGEAPVSVVNPKLDERAACEISEQLGEVLDGNW